MITIGELRQKLDNFSDDNLVTVLEDDDCDFICVYKALPLPPYTLPQAGEPIGVISTLLGGVYILGEDEER